MFFNLALVMFVAMFCSMMIKSQHLLLVLISLEGVMLSMFSMFECLLSFNILESWMLFMFMALIVSESSLGLGILVGMARNNGLEMFFMSSLCL